MIFSDNHRGQKKIVQLEKELEKMTVENAALKEENDQLKNKLNIDSYNYTALIRELQSQLEDQETENLRGDQGNSLNLSSFGLNIEL